ncbi:hypothetical protein QQS21_008836 [Conoideocrella luteorostrata]|uniref:Metallo-beta-lactamase domain-containing protein n=1 Tax=Conoideocrella luteorostrata TaxID=1105319 RepID=A0AAJ0CKG6_9HYPO|nr:hypothetical protein QQS21_008836 [Conoideocrella luteorostrata]
MTKPSFATPLPQSTRSEVLEWKFPRPYSHLVLTGRSRAAWHTSFIIPQLNLLLDAGLCVNSQRPKHVFLTHGHADHTLLAFAFVKREDPPDVYCPVEMERIFDDHILSTTMMNLGGLIEISDAGRQGFAPKGKHKDRDRDQDQDTRMESNAQGRSLDKRAFLATHQTHGVRHGDTVTLRRLKGITATVFNCDHTVPCVGYVFNSTTHRLKPEYKSLSGPQLKDLRESAGVQITEPHSVPMFAFLGDTTAATLASEPPWLQQEIPVVITECSFLYKEHHAQAEKTKHTKWSDLEPIIRKWPRTTFVLTHFSMRYSDQQICDFFRGLQDPPPNMVIWADSEA